jgi:HAD superfamily hydrolase (TIGR01509 family)
MLPTRDRATAQVDWQLYPVPFELVIFDCDGVLVDSEVLSCRCVAELLGRYGLPIDADEVMRRFLGRPASAVADHFRDVTGRSLPASYHGELHDALTRAFRSELKILPHVSALLSTFEGRYCLASSSSPERLKMTLEIVGLDRTFAGRVYTAAMVKNGKPAPDIFLHAAREMGVSPADTLVIEDSVSGVTAGKAAGMTVWGFIGGSHHRGGDGETLLRQAGADHVFQSFAEFLAVPARAG